METDPIMLWHYSGTWVPNSGVYVEPFKNNETAPYIGTWLPGTGTYLTTDSETQKR